MEFALVATVLFLLLLGTMQFGLLFYNYIDLTSAARDGARKASVSRTDAAADSAVKSVIKNSTTVVNDSQTSVTFSPAPPWKSGDEVDVKISYPYTLNILGMAIWNGPMKAESVVRIE